MFKEYCQWKGDNKEEMISFLVKANQRYLINRHHLFVVFGEAYCKVPILYYVEKIDGVVQSNFLSSI